MKTKKNKNLLILLEYSKGLVIPILAIFYLILEIVQFTSTNGLIPLWEFVALGFILVVLIGSSPASALIVYAKGVYISHENIERYPRIVLITNLVLLIFVLCFFGLLFIEMTFYEFNFGTIFTANSNWEYSWLLRLFLFFWIVVAFFDSIKLIKIMFFPFTTKIKK